VDVGRYVRFLTALPVGFLRLGEEQFAVTASTAPKLPPRIDAFLY
jgi:hypothetical protein